MKAQKTIWVVFEASDRWGEEEYIFPTKTKARDAVRAWKNEDAIYDSRDTYEYTIVKYVRGDK